MNTETNNIFPLVKNFPRIWIPATTLLLFLLIKGCATGNRQSDPDPSWDAALKQGHGVLRALYVPAPGFAYHDSSGALTGITVDVLLGFSDFVESRYGVDLDIIFEAEENWSVFYSRMTAASDGMIGFGNVTITEERREALDFSPPYMHNVAALITHASVPELNGLEEIPAVFSGYTALAFEGTLHEERLRAIINDYLPDALMEMAHSNDEILEKVSRNEQAYFAYIDLYNFQRALEQGMPLKRHGAGDKTGEQFGYLLPLNSTWTDVIGEYFLHGEGLLFSSRYRDILETHLGKDLTKILREANEEASRLDE